MCSQPTHPANPIMMLVANTTGRAMYVTDATYTGNPSEPTIMVRPAPMRSTTAGASRAAIVAVKYSCNNGGCK